MLGCSRRLTDRVQKREGVVIGIAQHVKPAVSLKGEFHPSLMDDFLPHLCLRESLYLRAAGQSGTLSHLMSPDETGERARNARRGKGETKKSAPRDAFFGARAIMREKCTERRLAVVRLVVLLTADAPQVRAHGLGTACGVFLREEGLLVGNDLGQIGAACGDHRCYSRETLTRFQLLVARLGRTVAVDGRVLQSGGFGIAVDRTMLFRDLARDVVNRVQKYYFSHSNCGQHNS